MSLVCKKNLQSLRFVSPAIISLGLDDFEILHAMIRSDDLPPLEWEQDIVKTFDPKQS